MSKFDEFRSRNKGAGWVQCRLQSQPPTHAARAQLWDNWRRQWGWKEVGAALAWLSGGHCSTAMTGTQFKLWQP